MELWQHWLDIARESQTAARLAEAENCKRSSASRYYYAAYQAVTAVLHYLKLTPPESEEGWSHAQTPQLIREHWQPVVASKAQRFELASRLNALYKTRIIADYWGSAQFDETKFQAARKDAGYIVKIAESILPEE